MFRTTGFSAALLCGYVAHLYGWHAGFGLAAIGMLVGLTLFACKMHTLPLAHTNIRCSPLISCSLCIFATFIVSLILYYFAALHSFMLPVGLIALALLFNQLRKKMSRTTLLLLIGALCMLIAYFAAEELWGSLLMVFSETHINRMVLGIEIPSSVVGAVNPLIIIVLGPLIAQLRLSLGYRIACAFIALSSAFFILYGASILHSPSILYLFAGLSFVALGEIFLAPGILSFASKHAPSGASGTMMGTTALAFSMGSLLSADVSHLSAEISSTFLFIACSALGLSLCLLIGVVIHSIQKKRAFFSKTQ